MKMKKLFVAAAALIASLSMQAQELMPVEGIPYFLPKTELHFKMLIEKKTFTPGEFAKYGERFFHKKCQEKATTEYRIIGFSMYTTAIPDSAKQYMLYLDRKRSIFDAHRSSDGILLAINARGHEQEPAPADFVPTKKAVQHLDPHDYMKEEILSAGSKAKMAELTALDIYEIRESRNDLTRGKAEFNPTDNEQLRSMLAYLDKQEVGLTQAYEGYSDTDTMEVKFDYVPDPTKQKELLFRFSKKLGMVDNDDLAGAPYYINVEDMQLIPEIQTDIEGMKPVKDDPGIPLCMPGKIKVNILNGTKPFKAFETWAGQYGRIEVLSANLFGNKYTSHIVLNPVTGGVETINIEPIGKTK